MKVACIVVVGGMVVSVVPPKWFVLPLKDATVLTRMLSFFEVIIIG
jgi:hypothetical protein